jgi:A/G-specific adenine glycosylase
LLCPVREHCVAFNEGTQSELPVKTKKNSTKEVPMAVGVFITEDYKVLINKRPETGLLAKLWEFPNLEVTPRDISSPKEQLQRYVGSEFKADVILGGVIGTLQHVFSHLTWSITVYEGRLSGEVKLPESAKLVSIEELTEYAFPVSHQKIWKQFLIQKNQLV